MKVFPIEVQPEQVTSVPVQAVTLAVPRAFRLFLLFSFRSNDAM